MLEVIWYKCSEASYGENMLFKPFFLLYSLFQKAHPDWENVHPSLVTSY